MFYCLRHDNVIVNGGRLLRVDEKIIGVYSDLETAKNRRERYKGIRGFRRYPEGFRIEVFEVDIAEGTELSEIYMVGFAELSPADSDLEFLIRPGYPTREQALAKLQLLRKSERFLDAGSDLEIAEYAIDRDGWVEGFKTVYH